MYVKVELGLDVSTIRDVVLFRVGVVFFFLKNYVAELWKPIFAVCTVLSVNCPRIILLADYPFTIVNC